MARQPYPRTYVLGYYRSPPPGLVSCADHMLGGPGAADPVSRTRAARATPVKSRGQECPRRTGRIIRANGCGARAGPEPFFCAYPGLTSWAIICRPCRGWCFVPITCSAGLGLLIPFRGRGQPTPRRSKAADRSVRAARGGLSGQTVAAPARGLNRLSALTQDLRPGLKSAALPGLVFWADHSGDASGCADLSRASAPAPRRSKAADRSVRATRGRLSGQTVGAPVRGLKLISALTQDLRPGLLSVAPAGAGLCADLTCSAGLGLVIPFGGRGEPVPRRSEAADRIVRAIRGRLSGQTAVAPVQGLNLFFCAYPGLTPGLLSVAPAGADILPAHIPRNPRACGPSFRGRGRPRHTGYLCW